MKQIADLHQQQGKLAQSIEELNEVLRIQKLIHYPNLHYPYDLLGAIYAIMGNYDQALWYTLASVKSAQATRDTVDLNFFYYLPLV